MKQLLSFLAGILLLPAFAQSTPADLPIKEWTTPGASTLVFYLSGDGGMNSFSTGLCEEFHKAGYSVAALDSKVYFDKKKTPEQATYDVEGYLYKIAASHPAQQFIFIGYSFGADALPFVVNRIATLLKNKLVMTSLVSPSTSTDLQIHWMDQLGISKKRSLDVVQEINNMGSQKVSVFFGSDEKEFPLNKIKLTNFEKEILPGDHHFDGNFSETAKAILKHIK